MIINLLATSIASMTSKGQTGKADAAGEEDEIVEEVDQEQVGPEQEQDDVETDRPAKVTKDINDVENDGEDGQQSSRLYLRNKKSVTAIALVILAIIVTVTVVVCLKANKSDENTSSFSDQGTSISKEDWSDMYGDNAICLNHLGGEYPEIDYVENVGLGFGRLYVNGGFGIMESGGGQSSTRFFEVEPNHTALFNDDQSREQNGVIFNVETVTDPLPENLENPILTKEDIESEIRRDIWRELMESGVNLFNVHEADILMEVMSETDSLIFAGGQGFFAACLTAYAHHLPLRLSPDDLWAVIVYSFAEHVNNHAEELRNNFVDHEGKKKIEIIFTKAVPGARNSTPDVWEEFVFPQFSRRIGEKMNNPEAYETLTSKFSTTTVTRQAAVEIALMATMKHYFEYGMAICGIPKIQLDGTLDDWMLLRQKTERLAEWMIPGQMDGEVWIKDIVLPILNEFVSAYKGDDIDYCFWQSMIKVRGQQIHGGCGNPEAPLETDLFVTGWVQNMFLYLQNHPQPNPYLRPWTESASPDLMGPHTHDIPDLISTAPVMLHENGGNETCECPVCPVKPKRRLGPSVRPSAGSRKPGFQNP